MSTTYTITDTTHYRRRDYMSKTYTVGTIGAGGIPVNRAGGKLFEAMDNGEFTSKSAARKAAAETAFMCARESEEGVCSVVIVASDDDDDIPTVVATATATVGNKRVRWS